MCGQTAEIVMELTSSRCMTLSNSVLTEGELQPSVVEALILKARATRADAPLRIRILTPDANGSTPAATEAVLHAHFARMAHHHALQIRDIFRFARVSTLAGLLVVVLLLACAQAIPDDASRLMLGVRESLNIFAWVAMWKPAELWLYAHLPERYWRKLAIRLSRASLSIESSQELDGISRSAPCGSRVTVSSPRSEEYSTPGGRSSHRSPTA